MRYGLLLLIFIVSCHDAPPPELNVNLPKSKVSPKNLVITISGDNKIYIQSKEASAVHLDSLLKQAMDSMRDQPLDTTVVVINADSAAAYGVVFNVMKIAKHYRGKVVTTVQGH